MVAAHPVGKDISGGGLHLIGLIVRIYDKRYPIFDVQVAVSLIESKMKAMHSL